MIKLLLDCLANDNYDLKKTLNYIMKNIIHDKLPKKLEFINEINTKRKR